MHKNTIQMKVKFLFFLGCFLCFVPSIFGQLKDNVIKPDRVVVEREVETVSYNPQYWNYNFTNSESNFFEEKIKIPVSKDGPFIAVSLSWENENEVGAVQRFLYQQNENLEVVKLNHHITQASDRTKSELFFIETDLDSLTIIGVTSGKPELNLEIHFFNPGNSQASIPVPHESEIVSPRSANCPCPQPSIMSRAEWCPAGNCPPNPNPASTFASHLIIHHSAGANSASDWSAVVRSIWDYHVNTNGWSDVGYNYLVDPEGKLYEGRGKDVLGAHFCGTNTKTMGICLIGTYTNVGIQAATRQTLKEMLAWYSCEDDIDPLGESNHSGSGLFLNNISGHRDGCATECPGESFYQTIDELRTEVADYVEACTAGQPDIFVEEISTNPDTVRVGEVVVLITKVKNQGNIPANNIQLTRTLNGNVLATNNIVSLAPGESETISNTYTFQEEGMMEFCANLDTLVNEMDVLNNSACLNIDVKESLVAVKSLEAAQLSVFPNPSNGIFILKNEVNQKGDVFIHDATGKIILESNLKSEPQQTININAYPKGVYFLQVEIEGLQYFEKIILQ